MPGQPPNPRGICSILGGFAWSHTLSNLAHCTRQVVAYRLLYIAQADRGTVNRPTVINCFAGDMTSVAKWWTEWKQFMFSTKIKLAGSSSGPITTEPAGAFAAHDKARG
jgi:predicted RNA-binding protein with EMAP domain